MTPSDLLRISHQDQLSALLRQHGQQLLRQGHVDAVLVALERLGTLHDPGLLELQRQAGELKGEWTAARLLVRSRLHPSVSPDVRVRRRRLLDRLLCLPPVRVVAIQAPAGSGKTMLAYDALCERGAPFGWYSVDDTDRDPRVFLSYLFEALAGVAPEVARRGRVVLDGIESDDVRPALTSLLNAAWEQGTDMPLVLDDVDRVASSPGIGPLLKSLLDEAPPNLQVWLLTRTPLRLGLSRLVARREAVVVDGAAMALDVGEAKALVEKVWGWPSHPEIPARLVAATGGWVTGMQLVRRQVPAPASAGDVLSRMEHVSAAEPAAFEYLTDQLLSTLSPRVRDFLLETSLLDSFDAQAAEAATGDPQAARTMHEVEGDGLFLFRLDQTGEVFRYHHLLGDFLRRALLLRVGHQGIRERHQGLARYFVDVDPVRAIHHAVLGGAWAEAARLLEAHGESMLRAGYTRRMSDWLSRMPHHLQAESTALTLQGAMLAELHGDAERAMGIYQRLMSRPGARAAELMERVMGCLMRLGDAERLDQTAGQGLDLCPADDLALQARMRAWRGGAGLLLSADMAGTFKLVSEAFELAHRSGDPEALGLASSTYGYGWHLYTGQFAAGLAILDQGIELLRQTGDTPMRLHLMMNRAVLLAVAGRLAQARAVLDELDRLPCENTWTEVAILVTRAHVLVDARDTAGATPWMERLQNLAVPGHIRPWYLRTRMLWHALEGRHEAAERVGQEMLEALQTLGPRGLYAPECHVSLGLAYALQSRPATAVRCLEKALDIARAGPLPFWEMKAAACLAMLLAQDTARAAESRSLLARSLELTEAHGYEDFWLADFMGWSVPLLNRALPSPTATRLLQHMDEKRPPPVQVADTEAEVEVYTLGRFAVVVAGVDVTRQVCARRKAADLLKLMLASPDLALPMDVAMEALWPDAAPASARHSLTVHVSLLRKLLTPRPGVVPVVAERAQTYRLRGVQADHVTFEAALRSVRASLAAGNADAAAQALDHARALYRGDFLPNDVYLDWLVPLRGRLRDLHRETIRAMIAWHEGRHERREAIVWLERLFQTDPGDSQACEALMGALMAAGDPSGAFAWFRRHVEAQAEHGHSPSTGVTRLLPALARLLESSP